MIASVIAYALRGTDYEEKANEQIPLYKAAIKFYLDETKRKSQEVEPLLDLFRPSRRIDPQNNEPK